MMGLIARGLFDGGNGGCEGRILLAERFGGGFFAEGELADA